MQQYTIVTGTLEKLTEEVNRMLADGWMVLGRPFSAGTCISEEYHLRVVLAQALVCGDTARRLESAGKTA